MGEIMRVNDILRTSITLPEREVNKLERILQKFDLI
jgi:hypothetical protein